MGSSHDPPNRRRSWVGAAVLSVLVGCGLRTNAKKSGAGPATNGTTSTSTSTTSTTDTTATGTGTTMATDTTGTTTGGPLCPEIELPSLLPLQYDGSTVDAGNETAGACGGGDGDDVSFSYTAPQDGFYVFDTPGSEIDTVLYVRSECDGPVLSCSDNVGDDLWSRVGLDLVASQTVYLSVDTLGAAGNFTLKVRPAPQDVCPNHDLGSKVPQLFYGNTNDASDDFAGMCGGLGSPDESGVFTAPAPGEYELATFGSSFDTILSIRDLLCSGAELLCNQDSTLIAKASFVEGSFAEGQQVTAIVDGYLGGAGDYALRIERGDLSACPDDNLGIALPAQISLDTSAAQNARIGTCGGESAPERVVAWTAPASNAYRFFTEGSSYDPLVYVRRGPCHGPERACNDNGAGAESSVEAFVPGGDSVSVVVDGKGTSAGSTTLRIEAVPAECPHVNLGSDFPVVHAGTTINQTNGGGANCGGEEAPEQSHLWTAPFAGTFVIQTFDSPYDTLLYVRDGGCGGPVLGCNDDESELNLQSILTLDLEAGQTIVIYVDGHWIESGDYVLRIE